MSFVFDPNKALAAAGILARETRESMYPVLKMLYLVDRLHLERYGRPVTGDRYFALQEGPVGTEIYDLMKYLRGEREYSSFPAAKEMLRVDPESHEIHLLREPDRKALSASDVECLEAVVEICKKKGWAYIRELAHDSAWEATGRNMAMDIMTIASQLKDGPLLAQHLSDRFPGSA